MAVRSTGKDLLWGAWPQPARGPKPGLSLERIAAAAAGIADADGLAAVSMQRVADEFGATAMSLYRYVPGRNELLDLMTDLTLGPAPQPAEATGWRAALDTWTRRVYAVLWGHPWLIEAFTRPRCVGPNELSWLERAVGALAGTSLTGPERVDAAVVLLGHVHALVRNGASLSSANARAEPAATIASLLREHAADYPALAAAAADGAFSPQDTEGFEFGLRCILDGIDAAITSAT
ncbi:TetR/AcrR family transcriptional regulator C-terminal domain-containing protein [Amycolatopsis saalfeldensis]|uniref:Regulatory protein, tetR family n=1 Tax=Amycolatopsis saalfeldensis TaxID=394193 RepID=A0A1H8XDC1_9PSEU|nr:TetR/AcrR family transcriptional regulator C-terminal domain-containing protein [Amycolatopsis saalfeldensis]SEP37791.1 regulatory protein, tetR family [Amycolatopsis saalfeldensis]